jgi:hypothetical protein
MNEIKTLLDEEMEEYDKELSKELVECLIDNVGVFCRLNHSKIENLDLNASEIIINATFCFVYNAIKIVFINDKNKENIVKNLSGIRKIFNLYMQEIEKEFDIECSETKSFT